MTVQIKIEEILGVDRNYIMNNIQVIDREVQRLLKGPVKDRLKKAMEKRVAGWSVKPEFVGRYSEPNANTRSMYVYPRSSGRRTASGATGADLWKWTSGGVKGRTITVKRAKMLRVRRGYIARTYRGNLYGRTSGYAGPTTYHKSVDWPGVEPRKFEWHIELEEEKPIRNLIEMNLRRILP